MNSIASDMKQKRETSQKQQAADLIRAAHHVLVLTHQHPDHDAIAASLAMKQMLEGLGKKADFFVSESLGDRFSFMPGYDGITNILKRNQDLIISVEGTNGEVGKINYTRNDSGGVNLIVTPKSGKLDPKDVTMTGGGFMYDLIIVLDTPTRDRIGVDAEIYKDLIARVPVIKIDHHVTEEDFGTVNLIDNAATATSEILVSLFEAIDSTIVRGDIATLLLAGILSDTDRFQTLNTTPKSLTVAAQLIAAGARRSDMVKNIFKTHSVGTLKLWGEVLRNIREDTESSIVYSTVSNKTLVDSGVEDFKLSYIMNELLASAPNAKVILLLSERSPGVVMGSMRSTGDITIHEVAEHFGGGGHKQAAGFTIQNTTLSEAERVVLAVLRKHLAGSPIVRSLEASHQAPEISVRTPQAPSEESAYAPTVADIDSTTPEIVEKGTSLLERVVHARRDKKTHHATIDFARLEKEAQKGAMRRGELPVAD